MDDQLKEDPTSCTQTSNTSLYNGGLTNGEMKTVTDGPLNTQNFSSSTLNSVKYYPHSLALKELVDQLTESEVMEFRDAFTLFDKKNDGTLTIPEIKEIFQSLGQNLTDAEIQQMINQVGVFGSNCIGFSQFLMLAMQVTHYNDSEEMIREAFKVFDTDGNGLISVGELRFALTGLGIHLTDQEVDMMIPEFNITAERQINYELLVAILAPFAEDLNSVNICNGNDEEKESIEESLDEQSCNEDIRLW